MGFSANPTWSNPFITKAFMIKRLLQMVSLLIAADFATKPPALHRVTRPDFAATTGIRSVSPDLTQSINAL
jgi:hypothetical protein